MVKDGMQIIGFILSSLVSTCTSSFAQLGFHGRVNVWHGHHIWEYRVYAFFYYEYIFVV